ncbi:RHS repeat domain-containing protein [Cupriavidus sp. SW-Y-13]|uniref:RHS repeat domain-containing protein n=1 Tax=Cupriavidus sp. SW-Y-13 TaxID=2653854 RepID=UPI001F4307B8|nr:hypothetical protein [Cupriavidus sp. SW-Y-13]
MDVEHYRAGIVHARRFRFGDPFNTIQYDAGNNVSRTVDRNGSETRYSYDATGRETQRIEGYGTADAKKTTTEWHSTWNLPLKVAAPGRVDYFTYGGMGEMSAHGWFPTADANGSQGLNAAPSGAVSSNSYGYDASGLMTALTEQVMVRLPGSGRLAMTPKAT